MKVNVQSISPERVRAGVVVVGVCPDGTRTPSAEAIDQAAKGSSRPWWRGVAIAEGMALTKDLGNLGANVCTPARLADAALELAKDLKLDVEVLERADMDMMKYDMSGGGTVLGRRHLDVRPDDRDLEHRRRGPPTPVRCAHLRRATAPGSYRSGTSTSFSSRATSPT